MMIGITCSFHDVNNYINLPIKYIQILFMTREDGPITVPITEIIQLKNKLTLGAKACIQSSPSIVIPDIVTSLPISTFALAQVTNKLIKKNLSLVTSYSIFIITPFFFGPKGCDYRGGRLYSINIITSVVYKIFEHLELTFANRKC